ncbi:hypothetical protein [Thermus caldilimi]|uniref:hypothetical protein n=1 Tax=Thermus caldilimi TaxID=2483360 RepID=UPI00197FBB86|nr:hypothetical protein [Thermus caldilimi]
MRRIARAEPLGGYRLLLGFDDGTEGEVAFSPGEFTGPRLLRPGPPRPRVWGPGVAGGDRA